ncbi:Dars2 [Acrasis kona]|uniref:Aspartate tRS n=1 Tax=Acrasis kona TaxID=1008807 RepID=A0AAW2ZHG7_9EUKA
MNSTYSTDFGNTSCSQQTVQEEPNPFDDPFFYLGAFNDNHNMPPKHYQKRQPSFTQFDFVLPTIPSQQTVGSNNTLNVESYNAFPDLSIFENTTQTKQKTPTTHHRRRSSLPHDFSIKSNQPTASKGIYFDNLLKLSDLGFHDEKLNRKLLEKYDNNIDKTLDHLINDDPEEAAAVKKNEAVVKSTTIVSTTDTSAPLSNAPTVVTSIATGTEHEKRYMIKLSKYRDLACDVKISTLDNRLLYDARLSLFYSISLMDKSGRKLLNIVKDGLHVHPTYNISFNGSLVAQCKERFKISRATRKFNYTLMSGAELKMVGSYGKDWSIKRRGKVVGMVIAKDKGAIELVIRPTTVGVLHFLALALIMTERKYTSLRAVVV